MTRSAPGNPRSGTGTPLAVPAMLAEALDRLRFGDIRLTVHDVRPVEMDVTEKVRLSLASPAPRRARTARTL